MNPDMLWFARPWWLLALLPLGLLCWQRWRKPQDGVAWPAIDAHLLPHLLCGSPRRGGAMASGAALLLAVLALAGPMSGMRQPALRPDVMRVIVVDLSPAMLPHLDRLKSKLLTLLRHLPEGENALLLYAGEPYLVVPPTVDANTIAHFIPELAVDAMPLPGNRPELALRMANQTLQRGAAAGRHIVWITARADVTRLQVSELDKVRVSVLQIAQEADPALDAVTRHTGGTFLLARRDDSDARQLAGALAAGDGWSADARLVRSGRDLGPWLLLLALPPAAFAFRRNALLAVLPLVMVAPPPAEALELPAPLADYHALRLLQAGEAEAAAARFADPRWRAAASYRAGRYEQAARLLEWQRDPDSLYNRGNALARQGLLAEALASYDASLRLRPGDADTLHNRDLVRQLLQRPEGGGATPPPPSSAAGAPAEREAARVAEQWLRSVPDDPGSLLRSKLQSEHRRRLAGGEARAW
jgi:Ca-activated chloride channel family protein